MNVSFSNAEVIKDWFFVNYDETDYGRPSITYKGTAHCLVVKMTPSDKAVFRNYINL